MKGQDQNLEIEVKFHAADLGEVRQKLLALGATLKAPRVYERNVLFDNAWQGLSRKGQILRLRQDRRVRLTFKGLPEQPGNSEARVREELELEISDFAVMVTLLERVGFSAVLVYEKYRESFQLPGVEVVLDELPFGDFVELEGDEIAMRELAERLDLGWNNRVLASYVYLMAQVKQEYNLPFSDLTFANFADRTISVAGVLG